MFDWFLADGGTGVSASWTTVIAVATLLTGTSGTTAVAIVKYFGNRGKNKADSTKVLIDAAAGLLTPYSTALEMANTQIQALGEDSKRKTIEIRSLKARNKRLEERVDNLEETLDIANMKLAAYEARFGPLTPHNPR